MDPVTKLTSEMSELQTDPVPFARSYQIEALDKAIKQNTIVYLETGSGKTLIAIMLLRSFAHLIRKPSPCIAVFLVPTVVLVTQQADAIRKHTDLKTGKIWGDMGVDYWDATIWKKQVENFEVLVMTPAILYAALTHSFLKIDMIKVLIFDECHNARGNHPYSCIMKDFYHSQLKLGNAQLPRIFGMTASPIKTKGSSSMDYWHHIHSLENIMNSKVYTCASESVLTEFISFPNAKVKIYDDVCESNAMFGRLADALQALRSEHDLRISKSNLSEASAESARKRLSRLQSTFLFCLDDLGFFLAMKAAESLSCNDEELFSWAKLDFRAEDIVKGYSIGAAKILSAHIPFGAHKLIGDDLHADVDAGYITSKVSALVETLFEYRDLKDLRCIIFVERVITAISLKSLLNELLSRLCGWKTEYTAGNTSTVLSQSRGVQNKIVEEFRKGMVNIIVATSVLEEGLDVQSCNLVIRFDPSATVCSFIQSRGRARMQNSDFILMVKSGDKPTLARVNNYLTSGEIMRKESLKHASDPCSPLDSELYDEYSYKVESTGAIVNLRSSVSLLHLYCSRLPGDSYFKPAPRFDIDIDTNTCKLDLPKSCQIQTIEVQGNVKILKQLACLEACKQLHQVGALTDNLVPDIMEAKEEIIKSGSAPYNDEQPRYCPPELIGCHQHNDPRTVFFCYLIELQQFSHNSTQLQNIILAVRTKLGFDNEKFRFELNIDLEPKEGEMFYIGQIELTSKLINRCQRFQVVLLRALLDHNLNKLGEDISRQTADSASFNYLLLPSMDSDSNPSVNWNIIDSLLFSSENPEKKHANCLSEHGCNLVQTKTGLVSCCRLENSLVCTPHNGRLYCITGFLHDLNGNSTLLLRNGERLSYKEYYKKLHDVDLLFEEAALLNGKYIPTVRNYLQKSRVQKIKESSNWSVELPPELCSIVMSPVPYGTLYSFSYIPSIMHRIESLLIAGNLKKLHMDHCTQNIDVPIPKILEAITTKKCQENFHLESLETLGDSFLKYAASQQLFITYQNDHEGLLTLKKEKMISNDTLCKLACDIKIPGFIRTEHFDPKTWVIPGDYSTDKNLNLEILSSVCKMYSMRKRNIKSKRVADVVEALIGAYVSTAGEVAALSLMNWLGLEIDYCKLSITRHSSTINADKIVNVQYFENLLKYKFRDPSLLVEALTHGSYMLSEIPRCYQRLEFIGDAVLDYIITMYLNYNHPGLSPGLLTDMRSCSVNNECYALCAIKADLQKHILHASNDLHRHISSSVDSVKQSSISSTFGWELDISFPKVLGDIIESLAGAIFIDSDFDKGKVGKCILPLLQPMVTPGTVKLNPKRELHELCQSNGYIKKKPSVTREDGVLHMTMEVEVNGVVCSDTSSARDKDTAKKLLCKSMVKKLKDLKT